MAHTHNYRITFRTPIHRTPDVTEQNAQDVDSAIAIVKDHMPKSGHVEILCTEVRHSWGWETLSETPYKAKAY